MPLLNKYSKKQCLPHNMAMYLHVFWFYYISIYIQYLDKKHMQFVLNANDCKEIWNNAFFAESNKEYGITKCERLGLPSKGDLFAGWLPYVDIATYTGDVFIADMAKWNLIYVYEKFLCVGGVNIQE